MNSSVGPGDYILVEPMVRIGKYYGTAFELGNAFNLNSNCSSSSSFCWKYSKAVFSGNSNNPGGGLFWTTLKIDKAISSPELTINNDTIYENRRKCFMSSTCGRGIGVFKYDDIYYKIIYHGNGGTYYGSGTWSETVSYNQEITIYNNFFTNDNNTFIEWTTNSDGSSDGKIWYEGWKGPWVYTNGQFGISNNELHLYARWKSDSYKVIYHGNGGYTSNGHTIVTDNINFGEVYSIKGGDLFSKSNHTFVRWTTNSDGTPDRDNIYKAMWYPGWSGPWVYTNGQFGISNNELHLYAVWEDSCIYDFNNINSNPKNRLELFKKYHTGSSSSSSRRNLLNFTIPDAATACGNYTPRYDPKTYCLMTNQISSHTEDKFTSQNISDYNDILESSSTDDQSYCLVDFELTKGASVTYDSNTIPTVKAGRMIFNIDKDAAVAIGTLTRTCYIHKDSYNNYIGDITKTSFIDVNDYLGIITLDGKVMRPSDDDDIIYEGPADNPLDNPLEGDFYKVQGSVTINYKITPVYVEKITGMPKSSDECLDGAGSLLGACRLLGYGVLSKFNDNPSTNLSFNFNISRVNSIFYFGTGSACQYKVEPEIIKYERNPEKGNLDLEFRVVDTKNPFNRNTKSNWSDGSDNNKNNNIVTQYITNRNVNNSYNRTGQGSLYTNQTDGTKRIILTPDIIQSIRDYNKANTYDDYTVYTKDENGQTKTSTSFFDYIGLTKVSQ